MDFELTEEHKLIQQTARDFADQKIKPLAAKMDKEEKFELSLFQQMAEMGFTGTVIPEEYGGNGAGNLALCLILEQINRVCASTGVTLSVDCSLFSGPVRYFGNEEQKKKYLPDIAGGRKIGAYALTEPDYGSDAGGLQMSAVRDGDDYVLNGTKAWITNGSIAELFIVFARTSKEHKTRGISAFIVEKKTEGFSVGKLEHKLGIRGSDTVQLSFENARVPAENRVGEEGIGFKIAMHTLDGGRIGIASQALGIAQACLDDSIRYAKERIQFGKPIADMQAIQFMIADMAMEIDAARLLTYRAAQLKDEGKPHSKEGSMAKLFASIVSNKAADNAVQIHGGAGYTKEFPVERYFRDAKITEIYEGTSEVQRIVISRHMLAD